MMFFSESQGAVFRQGVGKAPAFLRYSANSGVDR